MWSASIVEKKREGDKIQLIVGFSNGIQVDDFVQAYTVSNSQGTLDWLKTQVKNKLDSLNALDTLESSFQNGQIDQTFTPPTQAELDKAEWLELYDKWRQVRVAIVNEVLTGVEPKVLALKTKVQTDFKPEYLNLL